MRSSAAPRRAIVTGGGTGLGRACVQALLDDGYSVLSLGLDREAPIDHPALESRSFDVTDTAAIAALAREVDALDALVCAAGTILPERREFTDAGFAKVMEVNVHGTQALCYALHPALAARRGAVITFASMWSIFGSGRNPAYSASKGAVESLTRALAVAWATDGIRVNAVAPGWVRTRMAVAAMTDPDRAGPILARIPQGRWGEPEEVGAVVRFLVSPAASYVTGVVLPIDGGYSIA